MAWLLTLPPASAARQDLPVMLVLHAGQQLNAKWQARPIERLGRWEARLDRLDRQLSARDHRLQAIVEFATPMLEQLETPSQAILEAVCSSIGGDQGRTVTAAWLVAIFDPATESGAHQAGHSGFRNMDLARFAPASDPKGSG